MKISISVILPTHDRPESLRRVVRSVLAQSRLPEELVIVNDGADEIAAGLAGEVGRAGVGFIYRRMRRPSLPASRNAGIDAAGGDVLVLLDDDVELGADYLARLAEMYEADSAGQVDGISAVGTDTGAGPTARNRLWETLMFLTAHTRWTPRRCVAKFRRLPAALRGLLEPAKFLIGGMVSVRRRVVEDVRFNETFGGYAAAEDYDFSYRATQRYAMFVAPSLKLIHHRDSASRPASAAYGRMLAMNYIRIVDEVLEPGAGKWVLLTWNLGGLLLVHAVYILLGQRKYHAGMVRGLLSGITRAVVERIAG